MTGQTQFERICVRDTCPVHKSDQIVFGRVCAQIRSNCVWSGLRIGHVSIHKPVQISTRAICNGLRERYQVEYCIASEL